jgi:hypothetical protein
LLSQTHPGRGLYAVVSVVLSSVGGFAMGENPISYTQAIRELVDEYRDRCLWFQRRDYYPETPEEILRAIEMIERYGDRTAYERAETIRAWLTQSSRLPS